MTHIVEHGNNDALHHFTIISTTSLEYMSHQWLGIKFLVSSIVLHSPDNIDSLS